MQWSAQPLLSKEIDTVDYSNDTVGSLYILLIFINNDPIILFQYFLGKL